MPIDVEFQDDFSRRHIGPNEAEIKQMLDLVGAPSLDAFIQQVVPKAIRLSTPLKTPSAVSESAILHRLKLMAGQNKLFRSLIGMGYCEPIVPTVIARNILENPAWYTQYTPYQAEISQGRLEALLNFQTMIADLTGLPIANASLLDEATAAAEAMTMFLNAHKNPQSLTFFVSEECHPQTIALIKTRAAPLHIEVVVGTHHTFTFSERVFGAIVQYPTTDGAVVDYRAFCAAAHQAGAAVAVAADLMSLALLAPPGEFGADVALGNSQRFGVPLGYGGPHAAFFATTESFKRLMPGRLIGVSVDARGRPAYRMALQTREQHIRREKATSNICTAQVLLAVMSSMYAVYHGPEGIRRIATRIHELTKLLAVGLQQLGYQLTHTDYFDTVRVVSGPELPLNVAERALLEKINLRHYADGSVGITLDEKSSGAEITKLLQIAAGAFATIDLDALAKSIDRGYTGRLARQSLYLTHPVFNRYHSETEMLRYMHYLAGRDLSLATSMIPLGSCTMKLNATTEMTPISWPELNALHPFAPLEQTVGYHQLMTELSSALSDITGFPAVSLQPNSGAQGEYAGLLVIRAFHESHQQTNRNVCLIPASAHGTNPASAAMAGMQVVVICCDPKGNVDVGDLKEKAAQFSDRVAALMITYPSTHGVFESAIKEICKIVHEVGGQVYMDGANLNAQVGCCRPAELGADVCHVNLHKTFCIPHGGGGPGMGPIAVAAHLAPFLPGHPVVPCGGNTPIGPVSAAPFGSATILAISWAYIGMMGRSGLTRATQVAILNANYMAARLQHYFPILYRGETDRVAHEFILDLRNLKTSAGIEVEDVAKRLMDYGFHAPTISFPVPGTLMIEPTESESKAELDRFCDALIAIREEITEIERGKVGRDSNLLKNAPHTADMVTAEPWDYPYSRQHAAFPTPETRMKKFWPPVARINNAYGDRHFICTCPPLEAYTLPTER